MKKGIKNMDDRKITFIDKKLGKILFIIQNDELYMYEWGKAWKFFLKKRNGEQMLYQFSYNEMIKECVFPHDLFEQLDR